MRRIPWLLLDKHFKGLLTDRDQEEFALWIKRSPENQLIVDEIEADMKNGLSFPGDFYSDKQSSWRRIRGSIKVHERSGKSLMLIYRTVAAVAIPLLLVGFSGGWFWKEKAQFNTADSAYTVIISPKGQRTQIILPDNSKVWLNSNTTIKYPSTFNQKNRTVYIDGEAYFDVTHNQAKPFIVNTSLFNIKVYGTSFNVCAYKGDNTIETTLVKGKISINGLNIKGKKGGEIILMPNETFKFIKNEQLVQSEINKEIKEVSSASSNAKLSSVSVSSLPTIPQAIVARNIDVEPIIGWKEGKLFFDNESFESLATKFERRYDVKIYFEDNKVTRLKYTGVFEKENINQALDALKLTTPFEYKMNLKEIYISYKK
ncbi:MAG: FecR family protein [Bacteroidetes bacterium]|nr:FecR family protein [Bacteroidota bacterium]